MEEGYAKATEGRIKGKEKEMQPDVIDATKGKAEGKKRKFRTHILPNGYSPECCEAIREFIRRMSIEFKTKETITEIEFLEIRGNCPVCGKMVISTDLDMVTGIQNLEL